MSTTTVSGTGHTKKKRDWKAINANRRVAIMAKDAGISRYLMEQTFKVQDLGGSEFSSQIMGGSLTVSQALKTLQEREATSLTGEQRKGILSVTTLREVTKHWRCIAKALRKFGTAEQQLLPHAALIISRVIEHDKERVSGTGHTGGQE
jgi:hypothetical protein